MKLNHKIDIDILEFFLTGRFDYLKIGQTKEWILNNFPEPDNYGGCGTNLDDSSIWRYENIELHFNDQKLWMIFSDYIDDLYGGSNIKLEKWILNSPQDLSLKKVIKELNKLKVDFSIKNDREIRKVNLIITNSNVRLSFFYEHELSEIEKDPNESQLAAFCLM